MTTILLLLFLFGTFVLPVNAVLLGFSLRTIFYPYFLYKILTNFTVNIKRIHLYLYALFAISFINAIFRFIVGSQDLYPITKFLFGYFSILSYTVGVYIFVYKVEIHSRKIIAYCSFFTFLLSLMLIAESFIFDEYFYEKIFSWSIATHPSGAFYRAISGVDVLRAIGPFTNPIYAAFIVYCGMVLSLLNNNKLLVALLVFVHFSALISTVSFSGILTGLFFVSIYFYNVISKNILKKYIVRILLVASIMYILLGTQLMLFLKTIIDYVLYDVSNYDLGSFSPRVNYFIQAVEYFFNQDIMSVLFGYGLGAMFYDRSGFLLHNGLDDFTMYMLFLFEVGLVGMVIVLVYICAIFKYIQKNKFLTRVEKLLFTTFLLSVLVYWLSFYQYHAFLIIFIMFGIMFKMVKERENGYSVHSKLT